ncbi:recombinase RecA [Candidatus Beckwithbacteria bacterium]|nr:recombinase RecA [Candidatus Beckwithbacteria bacterium]
MARPKKTDVNEEKISSSDNQKSQRLEAVNIAMQQIEKQYGKGSIMKLGQANRSANLEVVSTGSIAIDLALGVGGLPKGRIIEIYGPEASGKTTVCLHVIAQAQKKGLNCAFIDAEHALDPLRAESIGVALDDLIISQPDSGEQALEIVETLIRSGGIDVVVVDSVAALVPKAEIEGEMGDAVMGMQARLMSQAMRKLTGAIQKSNTLVIFTNQIRMKIGVMFGNPETTTGGQALKFYSSIRIDCRKTGNISEGETIIGSRHRVKIVKNKVAPPFRIAEFDIMNEGGISKAAGILDVATEMGVLEKSGAFYKYKGEVLGQGREAVKNTLNENSKLMDEIEKNVWEVVRKGKEIPVEVGENSDGDE